MTITKPKLPEDLEAVLDRAGRFFKDKMREEDAKLFEDNKYSIQCDGVPGHLWFDVSKGFRRGYETAIFSAVYGIESKGIKAGHIGDPKDLYITQSVGEESLALGRMYKAKKVGKRISGYKKVGFLKQEPIFESIYEYVPLKTKEILKKGDNQDAYVFIYRVENIGKKADPRSDYPYFILVVNESDYRNIRSRIENDPSLASEFFCNAAFPELRSIHKLKKDGKLMVAYGLENDIYSEKVLEYSVEDKIAIKQK